MFHIFEGHRLFYYLEVIPVSTQFMFLLRKSFLFVRTLLGFFFEKENGLEKPGQLFPDKTYLNNNWLTPLEAKGKHKEIYARRA